MNAPVSIVTPHDPATLALLGELAQVRSISGEAFAVDAVREAAERAAAWRAFVREGVDSAERGEWVSQDEMVAWFEERVAARRRV